MREDTATVAAALSKPLTQLTQSRIGVPPQLGGKQEFANLSQLLIPLRRIFYNFIISFLKVATLLQYSSYGLLQPGVYDMGWEGFKEVFVFNEHRKALFVGLELAVAELKAVGCKRIYVNGSFVTKKEFPVDFDICWDEENVNFELLATSCRGLIDFRHKMKTMKQRYGGDIVPMTAIADGKKGIIFLWFFQQDRQGRQKGIIRIPLV